MECSKSEVLGRLRAWEGKWYLLISRLMATELRVWLTLDSVAVNEIGFHGNAGAGGTVDLLGATSFNCGNGETAPSDFRRDFRFGDAVSFKTADGMDILLLLPKSG